MRKRKCALLQRLFAVFLGSVLLFVLPLGVCAASQEKGTYIKWVDFTVTTPLLLDAMEVDIQTHGTEAPISWIDLIAALGQKYGGNFSAYQKKDLDAFVECFRAGHIQESIQNKRLYRYYQEAYGAVLGGILGSFTEEITNEDGTITQTKKYGLKAFHPLAAGYSYSHSDDFGNARNYGYKRRHLGHDMFGAIGTPVVAIESGYVTALGWNQYGGWRIGIQSFDGKRYYYYAHLRKDHPYAADMYEGKMVSAGEVIGYLGMTGYSPKENVNNIQTPHLHVGMEVIFDPSQKDGYNQIWISLYELVNLLSRNRVRTYPAEKERFSRIRIVDDDMPD